MSVAHLYEKISVGDKLTDKEVLDGMEKFLKAEQALIGLGLAFQVTRKECSMVYDRLLAVKVARGLCV